MTRIIMDVDDTITVHDSSSSYEHKIVRPGIREKLIEYRKNGFEIVLFSARNMNTFSGSIGKINSITLPTLIEWLKNNDIPYDEIIMGKPWCGHGGFYVDDKAIRPDEFLELSYEQILRVIK